MTRSRRLRSWPARSVAAGSAAAHPPGPSRRTLTLTGTLMGGYASTLFYLLWRFSPGLREEFTYRDEQRWVARYGIVERITRQGGDDEAYEDGRGSRRRGYRTRGGGEPGGPPPAPLPPLRHPPSPRLAGG